MKSRLTVRDHLGTIRARTGMDRNRYKVNPGLYCVGTPDETSPVFVTANYKLSFDSLRKELKATSGWILVVDTRGINVWCAAGKGTFSADEIALQVHRTGLGSVVSHRELILPQFGAVGVASHELKKKCGFKGVYGPVNSRDIPQYLAAERNADEPMRSVTFTLPERLVLVPVELVLIWKIFGLVTLALFLLSGIGPEIYSLQQAWARGMTATGAAILAIVSGSLVVPVLLPWIPGRQFWLKGALVGIPAGLAYLAFFMPGSGLIEKAAILLWITAAASYMAMNFTGATPYTSLSGVEKEMKKGVPFQCITTFISLILWLISPFL